MGTYDVESYWSRVAREVSTRLGNNVLAGDDEPYYSYKRKRFLELLFSLSLQDKVILEVGCGPGGNLVELDRRGFGPIHGVDISASMLELARQNCPSAMLTKIDGYRLPFPDLAMDMTFTATVLQHITDRHMLEALIGEIARVTGKEVVLFERVESRIKGDALNEGRPVDFYRTLLAGHGFSLAASKNIRINASYYACGFIRKVFNPTGRKEGEPLSRLSVGLQQVLLPFTSRIDKVLPSRRDLTMLRFQRDQ